MGSNRSDKSGLKSHSGLRDMQFKLVHSSKSHHAPRTDAMRTLYDLKKSLRCLLFALEGESIAGDASLVVPYIHHC